MNCYKISRVLVLTVLIHLVKNVQTWKEIYDADVDLSLNDLVHKLGLGGIETYTKTTIDGYVLTIERIKQKGSHNMAPVILVHGMTACSQSYFASKNNSIPMFLARSGFDVWLLNSRGTTKSSNHTKWNSKTDREFWMFSWQEIGLIDLPLTIDLVLKHNVHKKTNLIGHSEGSSVVFVTLAGRPEYNDKVSLSFHLGVSAYHELCSTIPLIQDGCKMGTIILGFLDRIGLVTLSPSPKIREFFKLLCTYDIFKDTCFEAAKFLLQSDEQIRYVTDWSFSIDKALCGGSIREALHYVQVGMTGRFAMFDYGADKNLKIYNSTEPPLFPLEQVKSPVVLWCGDTDIFCSKNDLVKLMSQLPNIASSTFRGQKIFSHIDFLLARDVQPNVYDEIILLLKKYS